LAVKNQEGNFYDRFRGRIMFPVFDVNSQVVGFGGRVFETPKNDAEGAKYINISNTLIYDKSRILYGLDKAKVDIRKKDSCILVEGYMDCVLSHQAGVPNVVAASGTALTPWHLNLLKRYSQNLTLSFDMDTGGNEASKRGIDLARKDGFNIKMTILPDGKDPADVIVEQSGEAWKEIADKAKPIVEYYFNLAFVGKDQNNVSDKKEIAKIVLPEIKKLSNKIEQNYWLQELARKLKAREGDLEEEMAKIKIEAVSIESPSNSTKPAKSGQPENCQKPRKELLEEELLVLILADPKSVVEVPQELVERFAGLAKEIILKIKSDPEIAQAELEKSFAEPIETAGFLGQVFLRSDLEKENMDGFKENFAACLRQIEKMHLKEDLSQLSFEIREAEREGELERSKNLLIQFNNLAKKLNQ
ncbi:MAG: toprim domain-containing protein, partial [Candidatus Paceibacterota bacterium]